MHRPIISKAHHLLLVTTQPKQIAKIVSFYILQGILHEFQLQRSFIKKNIPGAKPTGSTESMVEQFKALPFLPCQVSKRFVHQEPHTNAPTHFV